MKQTINIRGDDGKPKVGTYRHIQTQIAPSKIKQIEKKSINSSSRPKAVTTKHILDQESVQE